MAKKKIPFEWWPGSWGLAGLSKEIAKAEYELEGEELERKLAQLKMDVNSSEYAKKCLEIDLKYNKIDDVEYEKQSSTLDNRAWFKIIDVDYIRTPQGGRFAFEYDWNEQHIEDLKNQGYVGYSDEDIIEQWLNDCARQVIPNITDLVDDEKPTPRKAQKKARGGGQTEYS